MSKKLQMVVPIAYIMETLKKAGLEPYEHSTTGASKYIKFNVPIGGSLRIADHPQRVRYAYRWNLRSDCKSNFIKDKNNSKCMYYCVAAFHQMVEDMVSTAKILKARKVPLHYLSEGVTPIHSVEESSDTLLPYHTPKRNTLLPNPVPKADMKAKGNAFIKKANSRSRQNFDKYDNDCYTEQGIIR